MLTRYETAKWLYGAETASILLCGLGFIGYFFFGIDQAFNVSYGFLIIYLMIQHFSELI